MILTLSHPTAICNGKLQITGSKSESNRLLLLQALFSGFTIDNASESDDSRVMQVALKSDSEVIDVHHAGTAMRFLTAYFAHLEGREVLLTGSQRMQERPVKILVEALQLLGASIRYEKEEGYPPLRIHGKKLKGGRVTLPANISSQYISALLLIGPVLEEGIQMDLIGKITSLPYINMTLALLESLGVESNFEGQTIRVEPQKKPKRIPQIVESDWSSASYFFSVVALADQSEIYLTSYKKHSLQGDSVLREIYRELGVASSIEEETLKLKKAIVDLPEVLHWDLSKAPDIAQTIAVTCYGLGIGCKLTGLHTLKIKETDRLQALYNELTKLGARIKITKDSLELTSGSNFIANCSVPTYNDHRMAMAFAPLALKIPLTIEDAEVVSKSYPSFWDDLEQINFKINHR
ncbi:MAG: 3-phosphoshikimate 1-carboxyvinyltransferase [Flavobacteriaceae bacterium]|nr:3-phosphoshikimate 1-carboxyvinyltransferase [Flavobacteriaceae bacterium]